ncbi:hypothetical protein DFJ73DRAFT_829327 [Zopfochytrium polystomum]|nr:hypothetical protein DFJ73DRAFT_829327 [Zopfochytrium polystomum]
MAVPATSIPPTALLSLATFFCRADVLFGDPNFGTDWTTTASCGSKILIVWILPFAVAVCGIAFLLTRPSTARYETVANSEEMSPPSVPTSPNSLVLSSFGGSMPTSRRRADSSIGQAVASGSIALVGDSEVDNRVQRGEGDDTIFESSEEEEIKSTGARRAAKRPKYYFAVMLSTILDLLLGLTRGVLFGWQMSETTVGLAVVFALDASTKLLNLVLCRATTVRRASAKTAVDVAWISVVTCLASLLADIRFSIRTPGILFAFFLSLSTAFKFAVITTWALRTRGVKLFSRSSLKRGPSSISDDNVSHRGSSWPELNSSVIARIGFLWLNPLVDLALRRPLGLGDLWNLAAHDRAESIHHQFQSILSRTECSRGYFLRAIVRLIWKPLAYMYFISLVDHVLLFANPFMIYQSISAIQSPTSTRWDVAGPVFLIFAASAGRTACESQLYWINRRIDVRIRAAIVGAVHQKCLTKRTAIVEESKPDEANSSKNGSSGHAGFGAITNLMSSDTDLILACFRQSHYILSVPLLLMLCLGLLTWTIGFPGAITGVLSLSFAVPATQYVGKIIKKFRKELMKKSDSRMSKLSEILNGIRSIKLYSWEDYFRQQLDLSRQSELKSLRSYLTVQSTTSILWRGSPLLATMMTFIVSSSFPTTSNPLNPASAFTVLSMFNNVLRYPLFVVPKLVISSMELQLAVNRIESFLAEPDADRCAKIDSSTNKSIEVVFDADSLAVELQPSKRRRTKLHQESILGFSDNASFGYGSALEPAGRGTTVLRNLSFDIQPGKLTIVVGPTGCGKSSLLFALLGEMQTMTGSLKTPVLSATDGADRTIGYVPQIAWLRNTTIRENITFGLPYEEQWYRSVVDACALTADFRALELADLTEVGDRGVSLSGGQRQRICLARAMYSRSKVLLLDDVISAVDAHTANHILSRCLKSPLGNLRTIVLVTNAVDLCLQAADAIVVMGAGGKVVASGPVSDILLRSRSGSQSDLALKSVLQEVGVKAGSSNRDLGEHRFALKPSLEATPEAKTKPYDGAKKESREESTGTTVEWKVYRDYFLAGGGLFPSILFIGSILAAYGLGVAHDIALKDWSNASVKAAQTGLTGAVTRSSVYIWIALSALLSMQARYLAQIFFSLKASQQVHSKAIQRMLRAPMSFFDVTPAGRILNRFGKDLRVIDQEVVGSIGETVQQLVNGATVAFMIASASPLLLIGAIPIAIIYSPISSRFLAATRSLKRLEAVSRSPIYSAFGETLSGIMVIRAFECEKLFSSSLFLHIDANHSAFLSLWAANRWLAVRVELVGALVALSAGLAVALSKDSHGNLDAGWSGLILSYSSMFTDVLTWLVRNSATMEMAMTSVDRVQEYANLDVERQESDARPPSQWPTKGSIEIGQLHIRYSKEGPPAISLQELITITPGERIGIVGRTGAGKSTLGAAFPRFVEFERGDIILDGIPFSRLGVKDLRKAVTMVPQDAFLFAGTLRENLDPLGLYADSTLMAALETLGLSGSHAAVSLDLNSPISENGTNLSSGQRQLVSLGRAIIRKLDQNAAGPTSDRPLSGVLVLDEATSSLDATSDAFAQRSLRLVFSKPHSDSLGAIANKAAWTIITIAHRLNTIIDADRVFVIGDGQIVEQGSPKELLRRSVHFHLRAKHFHCAESCI